MSHKILVSAIFISQLFIGKTYAISGCGQNFSGDFSNPAPANQTRKRGSSAAELTAIAHTDLVMRALEKLGFNVKHLKANPEHNRHGDMIYFDSGASQVHPVFELISQFAATHLASEIGFNRKNDGQVGYSSSGILLPNKTSLVKKSSASAAQDLALALSIQSLVQIHSHLRKFVAQLEAENIHTHPITQNNESGEYTRRLLAGHVDMQNPEQSPGFIMFETAQHQKVIDFYEFASFNSISKDAYAGPFETNKEANEYLNTLVLLKLNKAIRELSPIIEGFSRIKSAENLRGMRRPEKEEIEVRLEDFLGDWVDNFTIHPDDIP